jgi:hypothetical protein
MTCREELLKNAREATTAYAAAKERHVYARQMVRLGMPADVVSAHTIEARTYSEWLRATEAFQNYRG